MASRYTKTGNIWGATYRTKVVTGADGLATVTFPTGMFKAAPVVVATGVSKDGRDAAVSLMGDPTALQAKVQARASRTLPLGVTLAGLLGFDTFQPAASATVHVVAYAAS